MIKNILFVDETVMDYQVFLDSANAETKAIPYNQTTTPESLLAAIPGPVDQVGIVFIKGASFLGSSFQDKIDFFVSLVQTFEVKHLDFLACDTLPEWSEFYARLAPHVIVGASNNKTGNLQYGGDWVMETTSEDVEGVYFTQSIQYYKYLLDPDPYNIFFTKNTGELYGMGDNQYCNLGKNYNKYLTDPTEVFMKDASDNLSSIGGIQKLKCGAGATIFLKDNKLYGFGSNSSRMISNTPTSIFYNPVEIPLPAGVSPGIVNDLLVANDEIMVIIDGRLYRKTATYQEIKPNDANDGMATLISGTAGYMACVFNNVVYKMGIPSDSYTFQVTAFPGDASGTVTHIESGNAWYDHHIFAVRGGVLYRSTSGWYGGPPVAFTKVTYTITPAVNFNQVTDIAFVMDGNGALSVMAVNNGILYWLEKDGDTVFGITAQSNRVVPTPTGTITSMSLRNNSIMIVVDGKVYVSGDNWECQLGGFESYKYGFTLVTNSLVTHAERGYQYSGFATSTNLYLIGNNLNGRLGFPMGPNIESVPIPIQINGNTLMNIDKNLISATDNFTWIAIGEKLYCSGTNWSNTAGLNNSLFNYSFTTKFIEIPIHPTASGPITFVSCGYRCSAIIKGGKLYAQTGGTSFRPLLLPSGVTGTMKALSTPQWVVCVMIENSDPNGGSLYAMGGSYLRYGAGQFLPHFTDSTTTLIALNYQGVPISGVTKHATHNMGTLLLRNGQLLYAGITSDNESDRTQDWIPVPMPAGASGTVEHMAAGVKHICVVIGGVLYGMGFNDNNQLGTGPMTKTTLSNVYTNNNTIPITDVTDLKCTSATTYITKNNTLYGFGSNNKNQLGVGANSSNLNLISTGIMGINLTIGGASVDHGPNGTTVVITGDLLTKIVSIQFGANTITTFPIKTSSEISFVVPNGSGTVIPSAYDGESSFALPSFTYTNPMVITSMTPSSLGVGRGTRNQIVRITGVDLTGVAKIKFGTVETTFTPLSATECSVIVPGQLTKNILVNVTVLDSYSTVSNTFPFQYTDPAITRVTTGTVLKNLSSNDITITTAKGGDRINILGSNFNTSYNVYFGDTRVDNFPIGNTAVQVIVPKIVGDVKIRLYDGSSNMVEMAQTFSCTLDTDIIAVSPSIVMYSATDTTGKKVYAMSNNTIASYVATFSTIYTHTVPIFGLAVKGDITTTGKIFFGDQDSRRIYMINPSTNSASIFLTRVTMSPFAMKYNPSTNKLVVACTNNGNANDDAILVIDADTAAVTAKNFTEMSLYDLRGITYNNIPASTDTSLYVTAVPRGGSITAGRVIKLDSTGTVQNISFITNVNDPRDLTFLSGYLVVDGILNFYSPLGGAPISSFSTVATTITTDGSYSYFSNTLGTTSVLNQITVEPYVSPDFILGNVHSPTVGPQGTMVFIRGANMLTSLITSITVNGATVEYWVNPQLIAVKMPAKPLSGVGSIVVTPTTGSPKTYTFTYNNPDIVNIIPLYDNNYRYYHFTGNSLGNILYVDFGDSTKTTMTSQIPVFNVTNTSFDCEYNPSFANATRVLLRDAYNNTTWEDGAYFTVSSETCFLAGTPVLTDQGQIPIDKIDTTFHTLNQKRIQAITKVRYIGDSLVLLEKDSLKKHYPAHDTVITPKHKIYFKGKMKKAASFVGKYKGVSLVPYQNQYLYNVLLDTHEKMLVNGLICETLYPKNPIAKFFKAEQ